MIYALVLLLITFILSITSSDKTCIFGICAVVMFWVACCISTPNESSLKACIPVEWNGEKFVEVDVSNSILKVYKKRNVLTLKVDEDVYTLVERGVVTARLKPLEEIVASKLSNSILLEN